MCGIAGILAIQPQGAISMPLQRMTRAMRHRGPDDEGMVFFAADAQDYCISGGDDTPEAVLRSGFRYAPTRIAPPPSEPRFVLGLGHRRLSILDLSAAGHQPMCTEDGRYWIAYNGEIYNFRQIRSELENCGDTFQSATDTEVILKAYRRWGADCLQRFNGMWSFAIWDNRERQLFCARDRIGIKPFYYYRTDSLFMFASDIKTLIASGLYRAELDVEHLYHGMSFQCAPRPLTAFKGVRSLEQAHWMTVDQDGNATRQRYWEIPIGQVDHSKTEEEWKEELSAELQRAVRRCLIADVPVGISLSGGIDSTTVAAMAATAQPGLKAFTLSFGGDDAEWDELPQAQATARKYPIQHIVKAVQPEETFSAVEDVVRCQEEPVFPITPSYVVWQLARQNDVTVTLCGLGGDELFCGYGSERKLLAWEAIPGWQRSLGRLVPPIGWRLTNLRRFSALKSFDDCYVSKFSWFSEQEKRQLFAPGMLNGANSYDVFHDLYAPRSHAFTDAVEAACYFDLVNYVGNHHVYREDQLSMRFSIESRFPLLDHELVELAFHMPSHMKVRDGVSKYILRSVAADWIDPSCLQMKKKGFNLPWKQWLTGALASYVAEILEGLKQRSLFRADSIEALQKRALTDHRGGTAMQVWYLVSLELWLRIFIDDRSTQATIADECYRA